MNTKETYEKVAPEYAIKFRDEMDNKPFDRDQLLRLANMVNGLGSICDMGCGPGQIARYLHSQNIQTLGVDYSKNMVIEAKNYNPDIQFYEGDMLNLPFPDESWGGIAAFYCIIHISRDKVVDALKEMKRTLKVGGTLLITFHIGTQVVHMDNWLGKDVNIDFNFFEVKEMEDWLLSAGFRIVESIARDPNVAVEANTRRAYIFASK